MELWASGMSFRISSISCCSLIYRVFCTKDFIWRTLICFSLNFMNSNCSSVPACFIFRSYSTKYSRNSCFLLFFQCICYISFLVFSSFYLDCFNRSVDFYSDIVSLFMYFTNYSSYLSPLFSRFLTIPYIWVLWWRFPFRILKIWLLGTYFSVVFQIVSVYWWCCFHF